MSPAPFERTPRVGDTVTYFRPTDGKRRPGQVTKVRNPNVVDVRVGGSVIERVPRAFGRNAFGTWGWVRGREPGTHAATDFAILGTSGRKAEAFWSAKEYKPGIHGQYLPDLSGNGHHMRLGSSGRAELLQGALVLPRQTSNYAATPADASWEPAGDPDFRVAVNIDTIAAGATQTIFSKRSSGLNGYQLQLSATGQLQLMWGSGALGGTAASAAAVPVNQGELVLLRATLLRNNGFAGHVVRMYTKATTKETWLNDAKDNAGWTEFSNATGVGATSIAHAGELRFGVTYSNTEPFGGKVHGLVIKNGINGANLGAIDFEVAKDGQPWFLTAASKRVDIYPKRAAVVDGALHLQGVANQYAVTPDHPDLDITGDIDIRVSASLDDWTPAATQVLVGKYRSAAGVRSYVLYVDNTGKLVIGWTADGVTFISATSTVATGIIDGVISWVRGTLDVDNGAGGRVAKFFTSSDGITWLPLGADVISAGTTSIFSGSEPLTIGANEAGGNVLAGKIHKVIVKNGIDGPTVFDVDFSQVPDGAGVATPFKEKTGKYVKVITDTTGADTNDPTFLPYEGDKYAYLPGVAGNYISTPVQASLRWPGTQEVVLRVAADDWTPASSQVIIAQYDGGQAFRWGIVGGGDFFLGTQNEDGTLGFNTSASGPGRVAVDGEILWLKYEFIPNDGGVARVNVYYQRDNGSNMEPLVWIQTDSRTTTAHTLKQTSTGPIIVGAQTISGANSFIGKVFYAAIKDSIGGAKVFEYDVSKLSEPYRHYSPVANLVDKDTSDLEGSIGRWEAIANCSVARVVTTAYSGVASLQLTSNAAGNVEAWADRTLPAIPGRAYSISYRGKTGGLARTGRIKADWYDVSGAWISAATGTIINVDGNWTYFTLQNVVAPANAFTLRVAPTFFGALAAGELFYVDELMISEGAVVPAWVPGSAPIILNRTTTGKKLAVVDRPMFLFGTDDYMECADHTQLDFAAADSFSVAWAGYGSAVLFSKVNSYALQPGWDLYALNRFRIEDTTTAPTLAPAGAPTEISMSLVAGVRDVSQDFVRLFFREGMNESLTTNTITDSTTGTLVNDRPVRIGSHTANNDYSSQQFIGAGIWREALPATDVAGLKFEMVDS